MPTPILQQMLGQGGSMEFVDAAVSGKVYDFLVVNTAATFTTLTGTGGENLLTAYALSGKSVSAGIVISGRNGGKITAVTPSVGSVIQLTNKHMSGLESVNLNAGILWRLPIKAGQTFITPVSI